MKLNDRILEYFLGETPQVKVIEYMIECYNSWPMKYPSKEEIAMGAGISMEELDEFYEDFIDIGFLIECEEIEDKHFMCSDELADGLFLILQEITPSYNRKMNSI